MLPGLDSSEERDSFFSTFELDGAIWLSVSTSNAVSGLREPNAETASVVLDFAYASRVRPMRINIIKNTLLSKKVPMLGRDGSFRKSRMSMAMEAK